MSKLLFIWYKRSKGILEGGGQCSLRNYQMLCEVLGEGNVDSYYVHDEYQKKSVIGYLRGALLFPFNYFYGLTPKRVDEIVELAKQYDSVFIDRSVFGLIAKRLKNSGYKGRVITHFHNVETVYFDALLPKYLPFRGVVINSVNKNDFWSCKFSDSIAVLNQRDASVLWEKYGENSKFVQIPITLTDRFSDTILTQNLTSPKPICLFLGSYFAPNNQGILWFVENVLPHVDIEMKIVGKGMKKLKEEAEQLRDIEVISDAPDLLPYLKEADIVILPIFSGSGMKVKTCETLMYGKNILGTNEAFEGYDVDYSKVGGLCNTSQEFIDSINDFIQNPRPRYNEYSRKVYLEKYSQKAVRQSFESLL